ncbi:hypothetical protein H6G36_30290 [Anabaena minutissima FACHB-250]|nr:hypothetical protein [Anabaena minutissima FACHB-250]
MNNPTLTQELQNKALIYAIDCTRKYRAVITPKVAINFWIKEFRISIDEQDIDGIINLFERTFFIEKIKGLPVLQGDKIDFQNYQQVKDNYICLEKERKNTKNSDQVIENYWLLIFGFFIAAGLVAGTSLRQVQDFPSKQQDNLGFQTSPAYNTPAQTATISDKESSVKATTEQTHKSSQIARPSKKFSAVFVVNISHQNIIDRVRSSGLITPEISDDLCRATKALWAGESSDFYKTKLDKEWISSPQNASSNTESTFDVYLIWVEFEQSELHPGFQENQRLSSRLEAFQWLAEIKPKANVSQRLPDSSYTQTEVYRL